MINILSTKECSNRAIDARKRFPWQNYHDLRVFTFFSKTIFKKVMIRQKWHVLDHDIFQSHVHPTSLRSDGDVWRSIEITWSGQKLKDFPMSVKVGSKTGGHDIFWKYGKYFVGRKYKVLRFWYIFVDVFFISRLYHVLHRFANKKRKKWNNSLKSGPD